MSDVVWVDGMLQLPMHVLDLVGVGIAWQAVEMTGHFKDRREDASTSAGRAKEITTEHVSCTSLIAAALCPATSWPGRMGCGTSSSRR